MSRMCTLHELAIAVANKQPGMVDSLTEDSPILDSFKWIPATHKLWNVAERLTDIKGAAFTNLDAPLPIMGTSTDLVTTHVQVMGGMMEVPSDRAAKFGGPEKYFADRQDRILREAGMTCEKKIVNDVFFTGAQRVKNLRDAGGPADGWWMVAVRFDDLMNVGIYDPDQFDQGRLLNIEVTYAGSEHLLSGPGYEGVLGYSVAYRGHFGWQMIDAKRVVAGIVNIDKDNHPTISMIDDMLADIRASVGNTFIYCGPRAKIYGINPHKEEHVQLVNSDNEAKTWIDTWNGIPIITSHNINTKRQHITAGITTD
ncbi:MAG: hypothetical protein NC489_46110 [Ruminococcus flavefaciens]|nr:hypothetical protein [Ruminococcus flavefaciens]